MPGYQSDHRSARAGRAAEIRRDHKAQWRTVYFLHLEQGERINDYRRTEKRNWQLFLALKALAVYNHHIERRDSYEKKQYRYLLPHFTSQIGKVTGRPPCQTV